MPHIHTAPGQHDITISAYIIRMFDDEWKCLVHLHKKFGKLLQVGGHVELNETPWAGLMHEIVEESGYEPAQMTLLQLHQPANLKRSISHPTPVSFNTHKVTETHYHTDLGYAFIVSEDPAREILPPESPDLHWLTLDELRMGVERQEVFSDVLELYEALLHDIEPRAERIPATDFSIKDPETFAV